MKNGSCSKTPILSSHKHQPVIPIDNDFGLLAACAIRYCIGRMTYMPHTIISYISPLLPYFDDTTINAMIRDVESANSYGDETIDKPVWMWFLQQLRLEQHSRKENKNGK